MDLSGKNVVYLGGFGGIGSKCIEEFLQKGIKNLAIFDLHENAAVLENLRSTYTASNVFYIKMDITDKNSIEAAYNEAANKIDHFDVIVNGCGIMNDSLIELTIQINLLGLIHSTLTAMKYMSKLNNGKGGLIVN
ncbi:alcohol dehydrogenase-like, partial [Teleopsis dalmanni]